jgi:hypothetical protein
MKSFRYAPRVVRYFLLAAVLAGGTIALAGDSEKTDPNSQAAFHHGHRGVEHLKNMIHYLRVALAEENASPELKTKGKAALKEAEQALIHYEKAMTEYSAVAGHNPDEGSGEEHPPGSDPKKSESSEADKKYKYFEGSNLYTIKEK